jgi:hypothetical protein
LDSVLFILCKNNRIQQTKNTTLFTTHRARAQEKNLSSGLILKDFCISGFSATPALQRKSGHEIKSFTPV